MVNRVVREHVVAAVIDRLAGVEVNDRKRSETLRQLEVLIDRKTARDPDMASAWKAAKQSPQDHRKEIDRLLSRLIDKDAVVRRLVSSLAPSQQLFREIRYDEFKVAVEPVRGEPGRMMTRVLESSCGQANAPFAPPIAEGLELDGLVRACEAEMTGKRARNMVVSSVSEAPGPPGVLLETLGTALAEALFAGDIRRCWEEAQATARQRSHGLRLRLAFDLGDERIIPVAALPWELLDGPGEGGKPLCLCRFNSMVRGDIHQRVGVPSLTAPPLRVLVASACPRDLDQLEVEEEAESVASALARKRGVEVVHLRKASWKSLRSYLLSFEPHVVHFMGHGGYSEGMGQLIFQHPDGQREPVTSAEMAITLHDVPSLRLVVLNACNTGTLPRHRGLDPFSGVASGLARDGIAAVMAMQWKVYDDAAIELAEMLYQRIADGDGLETALVEARQAVHHLGPDSWDWACPVLYLQVRDGYQIVGELARNTDVR